MFTPVLTFGTWAFGFYDATADGGVVFATIQPAA